MSFFMDRKHFMEDTFVIWSFALFLALACVIINKGEERIVKNGEQKMITYNLEESGTHQVVETAGKTAEPGMLNARYALLMDAKNRRVLYEKSAYEQVPMASTTKIMTLLVTLENANLDDVVTVSDYAASMPDVQLNIRSGEQYRLGDLVYSLMLESHNDSAVAIAEHVGGSVEGFAAMMNEKAKELGAYQTNFVTPNGLDHDNHYTTAYDLALIASYAITNDEFLHIIQTPEYSFKEKTKCRAFTVTNKDRFLTSYRGALGIKTGFTGKAGYCFVGAAERDGKRLVSVVLAAGWPPHKEYKWNDTMKLMNYGMDSYAEKEVLTKDTNFQQVAVTDSVEDEPITPYLDEAVSLLLREDEDVSMEVELPEVLPAPVKKGQTIGKVTVKINGAEYKILPLYSADSRTKITFQYIFHRIVSQYFLLEAG